MQGKENLPVSRITGKEPLWPGGDREDKLLTRACKEERYMEGNIKIGRLIISAIIITIVAQLIDWGGAMLGLGYYKDPAYAKVWSKLMMPTAGPPPPSFMAYSLLFAFISAVLFVLVFQILRQGVPGSGPAMKGLTYGFLVFLIAAIPGMLSMYLLINLPVGLLWIWTAECFIVYLLTGLIVGAINKA